MDELIQTRKCKLCGEDKPLTEFSTSSNKNGNRYYRSRCKKCNAKLQSEYRETDIGKKITKEYSEKPEVKDKRKNYTREYYHTETGHKNMRESYELYRQSEKGKVARKEAQDRYRRSSKGIATRKDYYQRKKVEKELEVIP